MLVSYHPPLSLHLYAALNEVLEVTQTGETCPLPTENLNMGKLSCPPAVGRSRRENFRGCVGGGGGGAASGETDMKTLHAFALAVQKQYTPLVFD